MTSAWTARTIGLAAALALAAEAAPSRAQEQAEFGQEESDLAFSGQVSGTVLTVEREPVRGVSVALVAEGGVRVHGTNTDEKGRYAVKGLERSTYSVMVMDPRGSLMRKDQVSVRPLFRNLVDFVAEPWGPPPTRAWIRHVGDGEVEVHPASLKGSLITEKGEPVPEAWVTLSRMGVEEPSLRARTDAEGNFRLLEVSAGHYRISARALGHVTWSLGPIPLQEAKEISLKLTLLPFPLGHPENLEDLVVPVDPVPPEEFEKEDTPG
jgi:hypothetical protein